MTEPTDDGLSAADKLKQALARKKEAASGGGGGSAPSKGSPASNRMAASQAVAANKPAFRRASKRG